MNKFKEHINMSSILLIGPRQNKHNKNDTGGITILFELLITDLKKNNIEFTVIDTLKVNKERVYFFDTMRAMLIIFIVIIHILQVLIQMLLG